MFMGNSLPGWNVGADGPTVSSFMPSAEQVPPVVVTGAPQGGSFGIANARDDLLAGV